MCIRLSEKLKRKRDGSAEDTSEFDPADRDDRDYVKTEKSFSNSRAQAEIEFRMKSQGEQNFRQQPHSYSNKSFMQNNLNSKMKSVQIGNYQEQQDYRQNSSHFQDNFGYAENMPKQLSSKGGESSSYCDKYVVPQAASNFMNAQRLNPNAAYFAGMSSMHPYQLDLLSNPQFNSMGRMGYPSAQMNQTPLPRWGGGNGMFNQPTSPVSSPDSLIDLAASCKDVLPIPKNATNTVYVEGIPTNTSEREVARKSLCVICRYLQAVPGVQISQTHSKREEERRQTTFLLRRL